MEEIVSSVKRDYIIDLVKQGKRIDGRALDQLREVVVEKGVIKTANGSAKVKLGKTQVLVGVKLMHAEPFPDTPESGVLIVNAELLPLASPTFEPGPPRVEAIELARVVDRGIRESEAIDLDKLGIKPGEDVWSVFIDIDVLDHDGGLIDASALASIAALTDVKPPQDEDWKLPGFPLNRLPVAVTVAKIDGKLVVDPCLDEERVMDARLTITTIEDGSICSMQKGGRGYFTREELEQAYDLASAKAVELREKLR
ncbi:MAG: RNA-binding protein [Candidatus Hadarchaeum yellowstonense]|jgi:exosome complex component RRP42|uniref:Exosome complex component Rrp42 n=1 Tax=Hadarchaeum yellowstonense TaxID=1776334 RepID=A0A147JXV2_HADYE|nr:MAG: RNA-binding protein [Candidatus Hadarchaeum yellowstonense]